MTASSRLIDVFEHTLAGELFPPHVVDDSLSVWHVALSAVCVVLWLTLAVVTYVDLTVHYAGPLERRIRNWLLITAALACWASVYNTCALEIKTVHDSVVYIAWEPGNFSPSIHTAAVYAFWAIHCSYRSNNALTYIQSGWKCALAGICMWFACAVLYTSSCKTCVGFNNNWIPNAIATGTAAWTTYTERGTIQTSSNVYAPLVLGRRRGCLVLILLWLLLIEQTTAGVRVHNKSQMHLLDVLTFHATTAIIVCISALYTYTSPLVEQFSRARMHDRQVIHMQCK